MAKSPIKCVWRGLLLAGGVSALSAADVQTPALPAQPAPLAKWETGDIDLVPRVFQSEPHIDVMIVTELTKAGRAAPAASPEHPVYYSGEDGGQTAVGDAIGGDRAPKPADLARLMTRSLHAGGFLPANPGHPPTIYIYYRWGSFNKLSDLDHTSQIAAVGATNVDGPMDDLQVRNLLERAALVGGTKFAAAWGQSLEAGTFPSWENSSARNSFLVTVASGNLYFIIATACDYDAAVKGSVVVLWQTRISTDSRGVAMDETLPQMAASAATYIGHETDGPVRLDRPTIKEGDVEIGEPVVVREELPSDALNPNNPPPRAAAPAR
jgi:hypothetical protein